MTLLKCQHCGRIWNYKGHQKYYATCTQCQCKVHVIKRKVEGEPQRILA